MRLWHLINKQDGRILAAVAALGLSFKGIFVKLIYLQHNIDAITLLTLRMIFSLPVFIYVLSVVTPRPQIYPKHLMQLLLLGFLGYYLASLFDFIGLQYVSVGLERLILFTYPALVILIESFYRKRPIARRTYLAMLLAYLGLWIAFQHDLAYSGDKALVGSLWILACSICYCGYYLGNAHLLRQISAPALVSLTGIVASLCIFTHFLLTTPLHRLSAMPITVWGWSALLALFSTVLPAYLLIQAIEKIGASHSASISIIGPIITLLLGWVILSEPFSWLQILGLGLVLSGVYQLKKSPTTN